MSLRILDRLRGTIGFRLILWYSGIFIVSSSFLFALAYALLSSSAEQKNREDIHLKLEEYSAQYRAGGLNHSSGKSVSKRNPVRRRFSSSRWPDLKIRRSF